MNKITLFAFRVTCGLQWFDRNYWIWRWGYDVTVAHAHDVSRHIRLDADRLARIRGIKIWLFILPLAAPCSNLISLMSAISHPIRTIIAHRVPIGERVKEVRGVNGLSDAVSWKTCETVSTHWHDPKYHSAVLHCISLFLLYFHVLRYRDVDYVQYSSEMM